MLTARIGVPSAIKDSAYHENRESEFQYSEVNFNKLVYEVLRLQKQRVLDQEKIIEKNQELLEQKKQIMELCVKLNIDYSPLMVVYRGAV